jgi:Short C-terminal domain
MMGRRMVVRRRPLLRAAAVGGTFAAGHAMGRRAEERTNAEAAPDQPASEGADSQAAGHSGPDPAGQSSAGPAADAGSSVLDQLGRLSTLHDQGALTDDEFAAAKAKVLGSG